MRKSLFVLALSPFLLPAGGAVAQSLPEELKPVGA